MKSQQSIKIVETGDFNGTAAIAVQPITNSRDLFEIYHLAYNAYSRQKACPPCEDGVWIPFPEFDHAPSSTILVAKRGEEIIGSISLTFDGALGMPLDKTFGRAPFLFRNQGQRLAEVWRLVVKEETSENIVVRLLQEAVALLKIGEVKTAFMSTLLPADIPICHNVLNAVTLWSRHTNPENESHLNTLLRFNVSV